MAKTPVHVQLYLDDRELPLFQQWVDSNRKAGHVYRKAGRVVGSKAFAVGELIRKTLKEFKPSSRLITEGARSEVGAARVRVNPLEDADRWWLHANRLAEKDPDFARYLRKLEATDDEVRVPFRWVEKARRVKGFSFAPLVINGPSVKHENGSEGHCTRLRPDAMALLRSHVSRSGMNIGEFIRRSIHVALRWKPGAKKSQATTPVRYKRGRTSNVHVVFSPKDWRIVEKRAAECGLSEAVILRAHVCSALLKSKYLNETEKAAIDESWLYFGGRGDLMRGRHKPWASGQTFKEVPPPPNVSKKPEPKRLHRFRLKKTSASSSKAPKAKAA